MAKKIYIDNRVTTNGKKSNIEQNNSLDLNNYIKTIINENQPWIETTINISSAQILASGLFNFILLPSPGEGKYYNIESLFIEYIFNTSDYVYTSAKLKINSVEYILNAGLLSFGENAFQKVLQNPSDVELTDYPIILNVVDGFGNPSGGDGTIKVKIKYRVETFG